MVELDIEIWPTSIVVPKGYRVGLSIRGKDYVYPGPSGGKLSNFKNELTGCGPFLHDDPRDRPPKIFGGVTTLHFGGKRQAFMLLPMIPPQKAPRPQDPVTQAAAGNPDDPVEQIRADRRAQARQAGPRGAAEERSPSTSTPMSRCRRRRSSSSRISIPMKNAMVLHATPETRALNQKQEADIRPRITGYDQRLNDLDAMGIDFQLVMPPPPQCYYTVPIEIAVRGGAHRQRRHRRISSPASPTASPGSAACRCRTATRPPRSSSAASSTLGLKGVQILTNVNGQELSDPAFAPFWKKAEELQALVAAASARLHRGQAARRASPSTTPSAIRSIPRSRCTT